MENFGVQSKSFETYKKFKDICEQQGWVYNDQFSTFREEEMVPHNQCLYFSPMWDSNSQEGPRFAFSNTSKIKINLDTDFNLGVGTAFKYLHELDPKKVKLATIAQWFSLLPDGYRERAEANVDIDKCSVLVENMSEALARGFSWKDSPERDIFWYQVSKNYLTPTLLPPLPDKIKETFKEGDWVTLTSSSKNFNEDMQELVGKRVQIRTTDGDIITFKEDTDWMWRYSDGHFKLDTKEEFDILPEKALIERDQTLRSKYRDPLIIDGITGYITSYGSAWYLNLPSTMSNISTIFDKIEVDKRDFTMEVLGYEIGGFSPFCKTKSDLITLWSAVQRELDKVKLSPEPVKGKKGLLVHLPESIKEEKPKEFLPHIFTEIKPILINIPKI